MSLTNRQVNSLRARSNKALMHTVDSMLKPFSVQYAPRKLSSIECDREPVRDSVLLAQFMCVHGKPYILRDTKYGCHHCGFAGNKKVNPAALVSRIK